MPTVRKSERTFCLKCDSQHWRELHTVDVKLGEQMVGHLKLCAWCTGSLRDYYLELFAEEYREEWNRLNTVIDGIKKLVNE